MSHSLSLEVMEMAEAAALLDRLASGLDEFPRRSTVPSSSARERTEPPDRTCCWSLERTQRDDMTWELLLCNKCRVRVYLSDKYINRLHKNIKTQPAKKHLPVTDVLSVFQESRSKNQPNEYNLFFYFLFYKTSHYILSPRQIYM